MLTGDGQFSLPCDRNAGGPRPIPPGSGLFSTINAVRLLRINSTA